MTTEEIKPEALILTGDMAKDWRRFERRVGVMESEEFLDQTLFQSLLEIDCLWDKKARNPENCSKCDCRDLCKDTLWQVFHGK